MKLVISIAALVLAVGFGVFAVMSVVQAEVTVNTDKVQGVFNLKKNEFNGVVSGWSSGGGLGTSMADIKAQAATARNIRVAVGAGGAAIFFIVGFVLLRSVLKARKNLPG